MFKATILTLGLCGLLSGQALLQAQPKADAARSPIEGEYTIVSGEKDGKPIPADHLKGHAVRITATQIKGTDNERKEFFACTYTLDGKTEPWTIRMKSTVPKDGPDSTGLVKRSGDTVTLIYALPGGDPPTEFRTKDKQQMFVLKAVKGGKADKASGRGE